MIEKEIREENKIQGNQQVKESRNKSQEDLRVLQLTLPKKALYLDRNCELTERDIEMFVFLDRYGVATLGQLWSIFFKGVSQETVPWLFLEQKADGKGVFNAAYQRLIKLTAAGYLDRRVASGQIMFKPAAKAQWQLSKRGLTKFAKPPSWPQEVETEHALTLTACGAIFKSMLGLTVIAQREIHSDYAKLSEIDREDDGGRSYLPDFYLQYDGRRLRFEFERTLKSDRRYKEYWDWLGACMCAQQPYLLYLTATDGIKHHLLRLADEGYHPGLYVCCLDDFKDALGKATFKNTFGKVTDLKEHEIMDLRSEATSIQSGLLLTGIK